MRRSWAQFGKGLGRSGAFWGRSRAPLGHFGGVQNLSFFKHGSKIDSKRLFGSILARFWKGLEGIWRRIWEHFGTFHQVGWHYNDVCLDQWVCQWGLAGCGHHPFCDGRAARHRGNCHARCPCGFAEFTLRHALSMCPLNAPMRHL